MAFTVQDLLLTEERKAQLTAALANLGVADPLLKIVGEASAEVARLTRGYVIEEASLNGWIRILALERAYLAAELGAPEDLVTAAEAAREELAAIASGKRLNLELAAAPSTSPVGAGSWGSSSRIGIRL